MSRKTGTDLTQGVIWKQLLLYFLPIAAGTIFQQLYSAVDAMVVGKFVGTEALAAVGGSASSVVNVLVGFFVALTNGAAIVVAQLYGAKKEEQVKKACSTSFVLCIVISIFLTIVGVLGARTFLTWLKAPADTIEGGTTYLKIYFLGVIFSLIFNMGTGILRSVGDSSSPFYFLLVSCGVNIILDLLFVIVFKMAVAGVAVATVISQVVSAVLVLIKLNKPGECYNVDLKDLKVDPDLLGRMLSIGIPAGFQNSMYSVSNMICQVGINTLGTVAVAGWSLAGKLDGFYWSTINAAGTAVMGFTGQNYGAGKIDRIKENVKTSLKMFAAITLAFCAVLLAVGKVAFHLFSNDQGVIDCAYMVMVYFVPFYILWSVIEVISGTLRGAGDAVMPTVITGICICLLRVLWVLIVFPLIPTILGISICYPLSWLLTMIVMIIRYRKGKWLGTYQNSAEQNA